MTNKFKDICNLVISIVLLLNGFAVLLQWYKPEQYLVNSVVYLLWATYFFNQLGKSNDK